VVAKPSFTEVKKPGRVGKRALLPKSNQTLPNISQRHKKISLSYPSVIAPPNFFPTEAILAYFAPNSSQFTHISKEIYK
jgi:hypothetical protein